MSTSPSSSAATSSEHAFFAAVIEGISNDKFMSFIDKWLDDYCLLSGKHYTEWPEPAAGASGCGGGYGGGGGGGVVGYTNAHHSIFADYQRLFESRLRSMIVANKETLNAIINNTSGGGGSANSNSTSSSSSSADIEALQMKLYDLCATAMESDTYRKQQQQSANPFVIDDDSIHGPATASKKIKLAAGSEDSNSGGATATTPVTTKDLVDTLLTIIDTVGDFSTFAEMMFDRQQEALEE